MTLTFFDERTDQSEVKARIIQKYFYAWTKIIMPSVKNWGKGTLAYIDLYAGPGRYKDGSASTPLLVAQYAINDPDLRERLVILLNDMDGNNTATLKSELEALPNYAKLKHVPQISCGKVDKDAGEFFSKMSLVPTFTFFDPFGYAGLSLKLINSVIKDWGCDCVFFFNYNRINMGIANPVVEAHMQALFRQREGSSAQIRTQWCDRWRAGASRPGGVGGSDQRHGWEVRPTFRI